jgi:hypothetical protein
MGCSVTARQPSVSRFGKPAINDATKSFDSKAYSTIRDSRRYCYSSIVWVHRNRAQCASLAGGGGSYSEDIRTRRGVSQLVHEGPSLAEFLCNVRSCALAATCSPRTTQPDSTSEGASNVSTDTAPDLVSPTFVREYVVLQVWLENVERCNDGRDSTHGYELWSFCYHQGHEGPMTTAR